MTTNSPGPIALQAAYTTDPGLIRKENQDVVVVWTRWAGLDVLALVCDGMGGHAAGSFAARLTAETFLSSLEATSSKGIQQDRFIMAITRANAAVVRAAGHDQKKKGMGSTLVAAAVLGRKLVVINVGDSPAYLLRKNSVYQLSMEHTWVAEQLRHGLITAEAAASSPYRNRLTQAVGVVETVDPHVVEMTLTPGDLLALSSDGVFAAGLTLPQMMKMLIQGDLATALENVVERCRAAGAPDNVSLAVVKAF